MKKYSIICSLILAISISTAAQVPGYMGKRFSLHYQFGISPQWSDLGTSHVPYTFHTLQAGYVLSRRHEIGLLYTRSDYSNDHRTDRAVIYTDGLIYSTGSDAGQVTSRSFSGNDAMLYLRFYRPRKGYIAPLGSYFQIGLGYQYYTEKMHFNYYGQNGSQYLGQNFHFASHDIYAGIAYGRNFIVGDRLMLNMEADLNWPITALIRIVPVSTLSGNTDPYKDFRSFNATDVTCATILRFKLGIGALLF